MNAIGSALSPLLGGLLGGSSAGGGAAEGGGLSSLVDSFAPSLEALEEVAMPLASAALQAVGPLVSEIGPMLPGLLGAAGAV